MSMLIENYYVARIQFKHREREIAELLPPELTVQSYVLLRHIRLMGTSDKSSAAGYLGVTLPQVTALTLALQKKKLISERPGKDRRSRIMKVTAHGEYVLDKVED